MIALFGAKRRTERRALQNGLIIIIRGKTNTLLVFILPHAFKLVLFIISLLFFSQPNSSVRLQTKHSKPCEVQ